MAAIDLLRIARTTIRRLRVPAGSVDDLVQEVALALVQASAAADHARYTERQVAGWYWRRARWSALKLVSRQPPPTEPLPLVDFLAPDDPFQAVVVMRIYDVVGSEVESIMRSVPETNAEHQKLFRLRLKVRVELERQEVLI